MKVLHLAAGNRWTGAAAPAFAEVESLRAAGVDAHYAYVGGYKLEAKLRGTPFAHPVIEKAQNPWSFFRSVNAIRGLVRTHGIDVLHAHLTYDHWLAVAAARGTTARVARTFHARRVLRVDPLTRWLVVRTDHLFVVNEAFTTHPLLRARSARFTPPPLKLSEFSPSGPDARALYGIPPDTPLVAVIGKLSPGRGFEDALRTFARIHGLRPDSRMMVIGHGEHRVVLERVAAELAMTPHVIWAGYHEEDLAEHFRAADVLLFTAKGSDEGHRAVLEATACGVPVAAYPIEGMSALLPPSMIAPATEPEALARTAVSLLSHDRSAARGDAAALGRSFGYKAAATRLVEGYGSGR